MDQSELSAQLGVTDGDRASVRQRAEAFYVTGKWAECIAALEVLTALGDVRPLDALMRARCHGALGEDDLALRWRDVAQEVLQSLDAHLGEERAS